MTAGTPARWLAAALLLAVAYSAVAVAVRPIIWSDSAFGFLGWEARDSLPFNYTLAVDPADISRNVVRFMSVWSPGQHLLPVALEAVGLSLGAAIVGVVAIMSLAGLLGWYAVYRAWGFPAETSALAILVVAVSRHFTSPFGIYVGGEVLLFGVAPWFLLLVWRLRDLPWVAPPLLVLGAAGMFMAKSSGLIVAFSIIAATVGCSTGPWVSHDRIRKACVVAVTGAIIAIVFYWAWYSRGWSAAKPTTATDWQRLWAHLAFAVGATWGSAFSLGDLANYALLNPNRPILRDNWPIAYGILPFAVLAMATVCCRLRRTYPEYVRFWGVTALAYGAVLVWLWVHGAAFDIEERYFRIVSLMLLVGLIETLRGLCPWRPVAAAALIALYAVYGVGSYIVHARTNLSYPLGSRGFRHQIATREVLDLAARLDAAAPDRQSTLVYAAWPELGLEFRRVRVLATHADFAKDLDRQEWRGRVPRLYVFVQKPLVDNGKAALILKSFRDYDPAGWRAETLDSATLYSQIVR